MPYPGRALSSSQRSKLYGSKIRYSEDDFKKSDKRQLFIDKINSGVMPADRGSYDSQKAQQWGVDKEILLKELGSS
jgi:hypothetical protein